MSDTAPLPGVTNIAPARYLAALEREQEFHTQRGRPDRAEHVDAEINRVLGQPAKPSRAGRRAATPEKVVPPAPEKVVPPAPETVVPPAPGS